MEDPFFLANGLMGPTTSKKSLATTLLGMAWGRNDQAEPPQKLAHRLICGFHAHYSIEEDERSSPPTHIISWFTDITICMCSFIAHFHASINYTAIYDGRTDARVSAAVARARKISWRQVHTTHRGIILLLRPIWFNFWMEQLLHQLQTFY